MSTTSGRHARAVLRLQPQSAVSFAAPVTVAGWRGVASTAVVCTEDRAIPVGAKRAFAQRCSEVVELPTSHSPFLSRPGDVAALRAERL
jgi:hypothetical protein